MTSAVVSSHLDAVVAAHPTFMTRSTTAEWGPGRAGANSGFVKVALAPPGGPARGGVFLMGGIHARELAPPDALVSFLEKLGAAYAARAAVTYPAWTDPVNSIVYDAFTIPFPWVRSIVESLDLYVAPCVNPDGRDFVLARLPPGAAAAERTLHKEWRKNRRPAPAGNADPHAAGVDLNRNFDVLWDFATKFDASAGVRSSVHPADDTYIGTAAESEPETVNVARLMRDKGISHFIDFHAYSRDILYCWGLDSNQSTDATQTFTNAAWDGRRDGTGGNAYKEYIPSASDAAQQATARFMHDEIKAKAGGSDPRAQARSDYTVKSSAYLYVTSGTTQDYCYARWFTNAIAGHPIRPVMALTIEVGGDPSLGLEYDEGGFTPDYVTQYPKLEREIHVAAWAFLSSVAGAAVRPPSAPPPPPADGGSHSSSCLSSSIMLASAALTAATLGARAAGRRRGGRR